ncbi:helix-turn-helix domain-containing protein [Sulfurovum sp.]|jgi:DNA-binding protein Fis|uniref:helix-turn-helix domain-containing protein n=1 Tax=Sulfurovum sp. TaxID=1969726 RepID=UPI002A366118|nr:helix-turn-helix domain-containing protein [Sulfurovum sp.]MDD2451399.1 helix-turn-helix domain-containing protein [Sulfurovum sp.]MDD3500649.1 helix-turn-helix domain-containing protein [Sulfurovum sp.]MDY0402973.1 helix-turn-helix domain-containing protein [Sulfurovum sp.]
MKYFYTKSEQIQSIIKGLNLTKTLFVSSIIIGPEYTGKKSLAQSIFPHAPMVSGEDQEKIKTALAGSDELIITNFEKIKNLNDLDFTNKRIIATANYMGNSALIDDIFAFIYTMPPLIQRKEDVDYLKERYIEEAKSILMIENSTIDTEHIPLDLSLNTKSLKRSVYTYLIKHTMEAGDIEEILYHYLLKHLEGNDAYRQYLGLYEKPLIKAGLEKFGSQLKLSEILGINRNTLRKKIHEHNIDQEL